MKLTASLLTCLALGSTASAQVTCYSDYNAWLAAAGTPTATEDFQSFTVDTDYKDPASVTLAVGTITVPSPHNTFRNFIDVAPYLYTDNGGTTHASAFTNKDEPTEIVITFNGPTTAFGCYVWSALGSERMEMAVFDGATEIGLCQPASNGAAQFIGFVTTQPCSAIVMRSQLLVAGGGGEGLSIDDLSVVSASPCASFAYCTAGTTSSGCTASISGSGTPSASATSGFSVDVSGVEGLKTGLIFYGADNTGFTPVPWGLGTSYLCVKAPTQRTTAHGSGGTNGQCDGMLSIDLLAYLAANPTSVGLPLSAGDTLFAQGWFRDPPSPKTTSLSDALQVTFCP